MTLQGATVLKCQPNRSSADSSTVSPNFNKQELQHFHQVIYFPNNSFEITKENEEILQKLAHSIKVSKGQYSIVIKGYASAVGNDVYNHGISYLRASYIKEILLKYGVQPYRIVVEAHGVDQSTTEEKARRVELQVDGSEEN